MSRNRIINAVIQGILSADSATKQELGRRFAYVLGLTPGPPGRDEGIDGAGLVDGSKIYFQSKLESSKLGAEEAKIFYSHLVEHQPDIAIFIAGVGYTSAIPSLPDAGFENKLFKLLKLSNLEDCRIHLLTVRDIFEKSPKWDSAVQDLPPLRQLTREAWNALE